MGMSSAWRQATELHLICDGSCSIIMPMRLLDAGHAAQAVMQAMLLSCL